MMGGTCCLMRYYTWNLTWARDKLEVVVVRGFDLAMCCYYGRLVQVLHGCRKFVS